jgi:DNA-directed RNA polymerase specialized sigma24 family protein
MRDEQGFADFASARSEALQRQAYLLTGSTERAARIGTRALEDTARRWDKLGGAGAAEEHARRVVATEALHAVRRETARPAAPSPDEADGEAVWRALAGLPPRRRAVLVLRYDEGLDDIAAGARLGIPPATAAAEATAALNSLRILLSRRGTPENLIPAALTSRNLPPTPAPRPAAEPAVAAAASPGAAAAGRSAGGIGAAPYSVAAGAGSAESASGSAGSGSAAGAAGSGGGPGERRGVSREPRRRRAWLAVAGAAVVVVAAGAAVAVPALSDDPAGADPGPVPAASPTGDGQLDWPARGPLAADEDLLRGALRAWQDAVPATQRPADAAVLYAGAPDGARTVLLQGTDPAGLTWTAEVTDGALRTAEPLGRSVPLIALGTGATVRLLAPAGAELAVRPGSIPVDGPLRPLTLDADGLSEPIAPASAGLPVVVSVAGTVVGSGSVVPGRLSAVTGEVEIAAGTMDLGPVEVQPVWYGDGALLARRLGGPVTVAAAGPGRTTTIKVGTVGRTVDVRAYETVRAGTRYLGTVVRVAGRPVCVEVTPVTGATPLAVVRCRPAGAADGVVSAVGEGMASVRLRLPPRRLLDVTGRSGDGLVGLAKVPGLPAAPLPAEARDAAGKVVARFTLPAYRGPKV